jgi:hypothetical protein
VEAAGQEAQPEALRAHDRVEDGPLAQKRAQAAPPRRSSRAERQRANSRSGALRSGHPAA